MSREQFPERNAEIIRLRKGGMWPRAIAKQMGLSHNVVIGVCNRAGLSGVAGKDEVLRGSAHPRSKLTETIVAQARQAYLPHSATDGCAALARRFGVAYNVMRFALNGATWAHVT